jgi:hypothetical protein
MAAKLTRLTHKIVIQLPLVAESSTICSSRSRRPVRKLLDTPSYVHFVCSSLMACVFGSSVLFVFTVVNGRKHFFNVLSYVVNRTDKRECEVVSGNWKGKVQ